MSLMLFTPWFTSLLFQHNDPNSAQAEPTGSRARQTWANRKCSTMFMWLYVTSRDFWSGTAHAFCMVHGISHKVTCWIQELLNGTSGPLAWPWLQQNRESGYMWETGETASASLCVWNIESDSKNSCNKMRGMTEMQIQEPLLWTVIFQTASRNIAYLLAGIIINNPTTSHLLQGV